jgi:hypothetical protein
MYQVVCDWPGCDAHLSDYDDGVIVAWVDQASALESRNPGAWESQDGVAHYCESHPSTWASDHENGEPYPDPPYLLIHDGDREPVYDGSVTLVGGGS